MLASSAFSLGSSVLSFRVNPAALDFDPAQIRALHHQVQAYVLKAAFQDHLHPGDRLNESAISTRLGISRTPVREALTYLEGSGLIVRRPRRGFFLAALSPDDAVHSYAMREVLEGFAARQVAGRITPAQARSLEEVIEAMGRAVQEGDWPEAAVQNIRFHETVVSMTGNPVLWRMWMSVGPVLWYFDSLTRRDIEPAARDDYVRRHGLLLAALKRNDAAAAARAFVAHITAVRRTVIARLRVLHSVRTTGSGKKREAVQSMIRGGSKHAEPVGKALRAAGHRAARSTVLQRADSGSAAARASRSRRRAHR